MATTSALSYLYKVGHAIRVEDEDIVINSEIFKKKSQYMCQSDNLFRHKIITKILINL